MSIYKAAIGLIGAVCLAPQHAHSSEFFSGLIDNTQFQLDTYLDVYVQDPANQTSRKIDQSNFSWFNQLNLETTADVADGVLFDMSLDALVDVKNNQRGFISPPDNEEDLSRFVDINTAYLTFEQDYFDIIVGKAEHTTGYAEVYSIMDRFNISNGTNPIHSITMGTWQAKGVVYLDEWMDYEDSLTIAVMPFDDRGGGIASDSRWLGSSSNGSFFGSNLALTDRDRSNDARNWKMLVEYKGVREGYDYSIGVSRGASINPVVKAERRGFTVANYKEYPTAHLAYGGFNFTDENLQIYGELAVQDVLNGKDEDTIHAVSGMTYKETNIANRIGLDEITPTIEYARERVMNEQSNPSYTVTSYNSRGFKNTLSLRLKMVYDSDYTLYLGHHKNLKDSDYVHNFQFEYKHNDNNYVYLSGFMFGGNSSTQFGRWDENDLISIGYVRKF